MADETKKLVITKDLVNEFESKTEEAVKFSDVEWAKEFLRKIWPNIKFEGADSGSDPELYRRLEALEKINSIIILPSLSAQNLVQIFNDGIGFYFNKFMSETGLTLWELVRGNIVSGFPEDRDPLKEKLRQALLRNEELITAGKIKRNDKQYNPSIKEWLVDYTSVVGNKKVDALEMNQYFAASSNFQKLSDLEKEKVRILITLYEKLKRSTFEPEGLEESVMFEVEGHLLIFSDGRVEDLGEYSESEGLKPGSTQIQGEALGQTAKKITPTQAEVVAAYQGDPKQQKAIALAEEKMAKAVKEDKQKLRTEFFNAVQNKNVNSAIAAIRLLAQKDDIINFLNEDAKLKKFLSVVWEKQYGKEFTAEFNQNADQPKFVRMFVKYVLQERLGLSSNDAARVGLQIGNILVNLGKKGYNKMAFFDVTKKQFEWFE